jgi:hypothetical protein
MAIFLLTGRPRHGKTYEMARIGAKLLNQKERVFSNLKFNVGIGALKKLGTEIEGDWRKKEDRDNPKKLLFYWTNIHEWEHFEKGNILVDEAQRYFNARQWDQLSTDTEIKLQQHGKEDLNIWGTTQHYSRIDITLRLLVEQFYIIQTILGKANNKKPLFGLKLFRITGLDLENIEDWYQMEKRPDLKLEIPMSQKTRLFRKKYAIIYDTRAKVGTSELMPLIHKERECPQCGKIMTTHS